MENKIQYYRKKMNISQEELGEKLSVSRQTVSQWETGQTVPSLDNLMRLKALFGVSLDELLGLAPEANNAEEQTENIVDNASPTVQSIASGPQKREYIFDFDINAKKPSSESWPYLRKKKDKVYYLMIFLFVLTLLCIYFPLITIALLNAGATDGGDMLGYMWVFYCFLPIPLSSLVLGVLFLKKGRKVKKNVVAGIIMCLLLVIYGSFAFMFDDALSFTDVTEELGIDFPECRGVASYSTTFKINDGSIASGWYLYADFVPGEAELFEETLDSRWQREYPKHLEYMLPVYEDFGDGYYLIYNKTTGEYNRRIEESGDFELLAIYYSPWEKAVHIFEYKLAVTTSISECILIN